MIHSSLQGNYTSPDAPPYPNSGIKAILNFLSKLTLSVNFQPILSAQNGTIYGYEALTYTNDRNGRQASISELFKKVTDTTSYLDILCRENIIRQAVAQSLQQAESFLFINICPETLMDPAHRVGVTDEITEKYGFPKEKIILEITEETAIHNFNLFQQSVAYYKNRGYKIAIDDFGAGYGGLKMLSLIQPDFIKIDRHFISGIDKNPVNLVLVDTLVNACHRIGIQVIAEGIEQEEEYRTVLNLGVELLQGYYLAKPSPSLTPSIPTPAMTVKDLQSHDNETHLLSDIVPRSETIGVLPYLSTL